MLVTRILFVGVFIVSSQLNLVQCEEEEVAVQEQDLGQNNSDVSPTAVATVYEGVGHPLLLAINTTREETTPSSSDALINNSTSSEEEGKTSDAPVKSGGPVRVQVACWDYRKIGMYPDPDPPGATATDDVTSNNETANGILPVVEEEIVAEPGEEEQLAIMPTAAVEIETSGIENNPGTRISSEETSSGLVDIDVDNSHEGEDPASESEQELQESTLDITRTVELVNVTHLMNDVLYQNPAVRSKSVPGNCTMVLFHAAWCPFSAKAAPHYNALPRAYPPLRVVAIDVQKWKTVNTFFGILGVPTMAIFHNGRLIAKFNDSSFTLNKFSEFIEYFTDLKHEDRMNVTAKDFEGPVKSVPERPRDVLLLLAWIFLLLAGTHYITKSIIWWRFVEFVRATWREAEQQVQPRRHEHVD